MADFNQVLETGDWQNGTVNVVVEIPQGSFLKIEWDRKRAAFMLDRVEPAIFAKPVNYGFIPQTKDEDGDELDAQGHRQHAVDDLLHGGALVVDRHDHGEEGIRKRGALPAVHPRAP